MNTRTLSKILSKSVYDKKKRQFTITFKDIAVAQLAQLMIGESAKRSLLSKTITFTIDDDIETEQLLTLLDITTTVK